MSLCEQLVRRVAFPLHEWACRRPTLRCMEDSLACLRQDARELERLQADRLKRLMAFARAQLPFYADRFRAAGIAAVATDPLAKLRRLPTLDKAAIRAAGATMVTADTGGGLLPAVTGGTSGDTLHFYFDRRRAAETMGARLAVQAAFGVRPGDRRAFVLSSPVETQVSRLKHGRNRLINEFVCNAFVMDEARAALVLRQLKRYQPRLIYGVSSALTMLLRHAAAAGVTAGDLPALRVVVATGEPVTAELRALTESVLGVATASEYGSREAGLIAHECPAGQVHVLTWQVVLETLIDGQPVTPGAVGELVVTPLHCYAQPLLRYMQGDLGRLTNESCSCGWALPVLELCNARTRDLIRLSDGRTCSGALAGHICRNHPDVIAYRVFQRALSVFEVWLVAKEAARKEIADQIRANCRHYFGPQVETRIRHVAEIPPLPSGKRSDFVCDLPPDGLGRGFVPTEDVAGAAVSEAASTVEIAR
jgi:phenylacetate-CoA ligase